MTQKNQPGYPLPSGELGGDEIVCQLVYLPDRPEYWQALVSSLHYLATWRAWERDTDKRGKDAAGDWRLANELTMECWRMACLQQLQDDVAAILAFLQLGNSCCDDQDITDGDRYTDRVEDGEGDVPQPIIDAGYADDAADWDGFDDYKCMVAHVTINQLEARLREIDDVVERAGPYLAVAAALSAILGVIVATGGLAIVFGILAGIGTVSALYYALFEFGPVGDLADDVATNHDELACAIYQSDGDVGSLVALNDKIDELFNAAEALILKNMNLGPTLKSLYAGRYDQQDIAEILFDAGYDLEDFDCDCAAIGEFQTYTDFETETFEGWDNHNCFVQSGVGVGPSWGVKADFDTNDQLFVGMAGLCSLAEITAGGGDKIQLHRVKFSYKFTGGPSNVLRLRCRHDGGDDDSFYPYEAAHTEIEKIYSPPLETTYNGIYAVSFKGSTGTSFDLHIDNITLDFDFIDA